MPKHTSDLVEFASDAAFAINSRRKIAAWNELAEGLLGYTSAEVIGRDCGEVLQATLPGGEPMCHGGCDVFQCFRECRPYGVPNCHLRHRNGEWVSASIGSIALRQQSDDQQLDQDIAVVFVRDATAPNPVPQHHTLQVFTLGGFGVAVAGRSIDLRKWRRKQATTLLKYLITQVDQSVHRARLLDTLWPDVDEKQGWGRLKVTMYYLRRELRSNGMSDDVVKTIGSSYQLRRDAVWVDAEAFERLFVEGRALQEQTRWSDALDHYVEARQLYRGDYLEEETFSDWCAEERERLRELYLEILARTAECHAELGQLAEAMHICRKALVFDPCRENFHYALMEHLVNEGHADLALVQYRHCEHILAREFDVAPLPKTQRLYQQIIEGVDGAPAREDKHS
jgi:two-component SAPR family response regulator